MFRAADHNAVVKVFERAALTERPANAEALFESETPQWWNAAECSDARTFGAENVRGWDYVFAMHCRSNGLFYASAGWID